MTLDGHFEYNNATNPNLDTPNGLAVIAPTLIRTGSGAIDVSAAGNVSLFDPSKQQDSGVTIVPGAIYTAGVPSSGGPIAPNNTTIVQGQQYTRQHPCHGTCQSGGSR